MTGCKCIGNTSCHICYAAMTDAFDKAYAKYKEIGMEDCIEAKEFMCDFFAERDKENAENINDNIMENK
jgi:hypothetical protein